MSNIIIGIHGLSNKPAPELPEDGRKSAILEGLNKNEGINENELNFSLVYRASEMYDEFDR